MKSLFGTILFSLVASLTFGIGSEDRLPAEPPSEESQAIQWYNQGYREAKDAKFSTALVSLQKALALRPSYAEAHNMLGFCYRKLGRLDEAFRSYERALQLKPLFPEAREYYGEAFLQAGNLAKAVEQYILIVRSGQGSEEAADLLEAIEKYLQVPGR